MVSRFDLSFMPNAKRIDSMPTRAAIAASVAGRRYQARLSPGFFGWLVGALMLPQLPACSFREGR